MQNLRVALWVMIGIGMLAGLYGAVERFRVEQKNRRVELTLDMTELQKLALAEGKPLPVVLQKFKQQGIQSVAITEDTLGSLEEARRVEIVPSALRGFTYLMAHQGNFGRIAAALLHRTHLRPDPSTPNAELSFPPDYEKLKAQDIGLQVHHPFNLIKGLGVGLDPDLVARAREAHLGIVGRVGNSPNIPDSGIGWTLDQLKQQGVHTVIFSGDDVLGFDKQLKTTRDALERAKMRFGTVEFSKMKGDAALQKLAPSQVIRVHTILGTEMATATPEGNVQRFSLAARERNMRLLYIRLFLDKPNPLETNLEYVGQIARALERGGLTIQPAKTNEPVSQTYPRLSVPVWVRALIGLGVGAAFLLLADAFAGVLSHGRGMVGIGLGIATVGLVAGCVVAPKLGALAAAVIFAALAVVQPEHFLPFGPSDKPLPTVLRRLARVVGLVTLGLTAVVGLLSEQVFLVKADAFVGIKLALYAPLLLATLYWALELHASSPRGLWEKLKLRVRQGIALADDPIRLWQVAAALLALVVLAMLWLRSGNDGAVVVTDAELRFRDLLDMTLPVRPRFKANLFGALMLGMYLAGRGERKIAVPVFLMGVIAVTDYLNTFCHLHIPLLVSVRRDVLGLVLGALVGAALIALAERYGKRR